MLMASFGAPSLKPHQKEVREAKKGPFNPPYFFPPLSHFYPSLATVQSACSDSHKKMALTVFLLTSLILTAKRVFTSSCPGTPLSSQRESYLSITCSHSLVQHLRENSVQMRCCTLTTEHHIHLQQDDLGENWRENKEEAFDKALIKY